MRIPRWPCLLLLSLVLMAGMSCTPQAKSGQDPKPVVLQRAQPAPEIAAVPPPVPSGKVPTPPQESGEVGLLVGKLLSREHYRRQPLDDSVSREFLRLYLDSLDYTHLMFLQSDIDEFQRQYGAALDDETMRGNVQPGFDIFARYVARVEQRVAWVKELLKEKYTFDVPEKILMDRSEAPWPANEEVARNLWRQRVKYELLQERLNKKKGGDAVEVVARRYDRLLRSVKEEDWESVLKLYLNALAHAYDPHSDFMTPSEMKQFAISMKLSLVGIGAVLSTDDGYAKVVGIVPGGPADLSRQLKVNDKIAAVGQGDGAMVDIQDMKLSKAVDMIRGKKNTDVRLLIIPASATDPATRVEVRLRRDEIKLTEAEAKGKLIDRKDALGRTMRLGYIDLPSFYAASESSFSQGDGDSKARSAAGDVASLIERMKEQKMEGLILDLRRNGGGVLGEAIALAGLFIPGSPVVQVKESGGRTKVLKDDHDHSSPVWNGPLVVLVSHMSASASEIFAGVIQDFRRGVIVGDQSTFGKGTVQKLEEISRFLSRYADDSSAGGALKLTVQKFYRVSGGSTQYRGVIPDIRLPSQLDCLKINEASLKNALPYDEVDAAGYSVLPVLMPLLPELARRSRDRVVRDPEFAYVREDMERLKARLLDKTVSLNEKDRLEEKKNNADLAERRKKERQGRPPPAGQVTEMALDASTGMAAQPAMTKKVMEDAAANIRDDNGEDLPGVDATVDPEFQESLKVLQDLIELSPREARR